MRRSVLCQFVTQTYQRMFPLILPTHTIHGVISITFMRRVQLSGLCLPGILCIKLIRSTRTRKYVSACACVAHVLFVSECGRRNAECPLKRTNGLKHGFIFLHRRSQFNSIRMDATARLSPSHNRQEIQSPEWSSNRKKIPSRNMQLQFAHYAFMRNGILSSSFFLCSLCAVGGGHRQRFREIAAAAADDINTRRRPSRGPFGGWLVLVAGCAAKS